MAIEDTKGLIYRDQLKIGIDELGWLQSENDRYRSKRDHWMHTGSRGLIIPRGPSGDLSKTWAVIGDQVTGKIIINTGLDVPPHFPAQYPSNEAGVSIAAIDDDGNYFEYWQDFLGLTEDNLLQVPDDATWYTLVVRRRRTSHEKGYLSLSIGSTTVIGSGTEFTRLLAKVDDALTNPRGAIIRIPDDTEVPAGTYALGGTGSALANEGVYEVAEIVSDTELKLVDPAPATEDSLVWAIQGDYLGTAPAAPDADIHNYDRAEFELVARTIEPAAGDLILADVKYDTAGDPDLQIIDRRMANPYRPNRHDAPGIPMLEPVITNLQDTASTTVNAEVLGYQRAEYVVSPLFDTSLENVDVAPMPGGWVAAVQSNARIRIRWWERISGHLPGTADYTWVDPGGATVDAEVSAIDECVILQVPQADGDGATPADATHLLIYARSNVVYMKTSTDNGATWSVEGTIWNPTAAHASNLIRGLSVQLLQCGRIILMASYFDFPGSALYEIRYITSDDLGVTWATNTNAGTTWAAEATTNFYNPSIYQDDMGQIHTAWLRDPASGTNEYVYEPSTSPCTLSRTGGGTAHAGATTPLNVAGKPAASSSIAVWADPNGGAVVVGEEVAGPTDPHVLMQTLFGRKVDDAAASGQSVTPTGDMYSMLQIYHDQGAENLSVKIKQAGGPVYLALLDVGNDDAYFIPCKISYTPTQLAYRFI